MTLLSAYLSQDRLRAIARGETLPDRTHGAALFADISGFTPLTEKLTHEFGPRRGAEELTKQLDAVYSALITEVERYGGSVMGFAGDAITCWFDTTHGPAAPRAMRCALALQAAMQAFKVMALPNGATGTLTLKVAVASGPARRFVVGDPAINYLDTLAGATVTRTAVAEHLAQKDDVLLDETTVAVLGSALTVKEWRVAEGGERFAVADQLAVISEHAKQSGATDDGSLAAVRDHAALRPFLLPAIYARATSAQGSFLTEFRPCVTLFVRFTGIDYDGDDAQAQLNAFIRQAQTIAARHDGALLALTIGDKGSYLYINFGALSTHEDDVRRAVKLALELRAASYRLGFLAPLQMGITQGTLWVGTYGGQTRRTYSALGDEVNLAARLMSTAAPSEILLTGTVQKAVAQQFVFEPRPPLPMKGKAEPLPVFAVTEERQERALRLQEPNYALPMVGRREELQLIHDKLELTVQGKSQIIGIIAEAGMGKSRLVAEVIRAARKKGFAGYGGVCQSDSINTPYQAWKPVWSAFFDVDPTAPLKKQIRLLEGEIEDRVPARVAALPLLGILLDLNIPDNDFTQPLEPKARQGALHALLEDCLRAAAQDEPLLIVIEDLHWVDALSHDLLDQLAQALAESPVCFVLAYRPPKLARLVAPRLEARPNFTPILLTELSVAEAEQAIRAKLAQLYPARSSTVPHELVEKLMTRAQGNPFYLEELLNFLRDRGLDPHDPTALEKIELPDSLHTLILSRIDQLTEHEKSTLRVASIVGRLFRADWLFGYYPALGALPQVRATLQQLHALDITPLDSAEPELTYLFKHIVTHEVTYESLPFALRAQLHEQLAQYLESIAAPLEVIANHYGQSHNSAKTLAFAARAGDAAFRVYALTEAIAQYSLAIEAAKRVAGEPAAIPLVAELLQHLYNDRGRALELNGRYDEALVNYDEMEAQARQRGDRAMELAALIARAILRSTPTPVSNGALGKALSEQALALADDLGDRHAKANILRNLMLLSNFSGLLREAVQYGEESLALARELGLRKQVAFTLNDLFRPYASIGEFERARAAMDEAREFLRETDDQPTLADNLSRSARIAWALGEFDQSIAFATEARQISQRINNLWGLSFCQMFVSYNYLERGELTTALETMHECIRLADQAGFMLPQIATCADLGWVYGTLGAVNQGLALARAARARAEQRMPTFRTWPLACLARLYVMEGNLSEAALAVKEGYAAFTEDFAQHAPIELPLADAELALANSDYTHALSVLERLLARLRPFKIRTFVSEALYLQGRALLGLAQTEAAWEVLQAAHAEAEALGARRIHWQVLVALSDIEQQRGHALKAEALRTNAHTILNYLIAHTPDDLRVNFLNLPHVQALKSRP